MTQNGKGEAGNKKGRKGSGGFGNGRDNGRVGNGNGRSRDNGGGSKGTVIIVQAPPAAGGTPDWVQRLL